MPRSGVAGGVAWIPAACRGAITPFPLLASAKAAGTRTTVSGPSFECVSAMGSPSLVGVDFDDGFGKGPRSLLRQVVADAAGDRPMGVSAGELVRVGARVRMRRTVGVAFQRDRGHPDHR